MKYENVVPAVFLNRLNRFTALAEIQGKKETVHVKNTGRCRELLISGSEIWLCRSDRTDRKTAYDLITVRKQNGMLFNIDSQAPNKVALEWLQAQGWDRIIPEYRYGSSRIDFCMEKGDGRYLMEVKGCTLEKEGIGWFPDAPTDRGVRHIRELMHAAKEGYHAILAFVIQTDGITEVRPNRMTDPQFADAMEEAARQGVKILFLPCHVETDSIVAVRV
ncbi:MAG: DNA/RNA nuclease SfsA [Clostridia bacterium]|nr:DNA/RNA nuclease SfsA [Clostridia bacterium]